ncbi:MAG: BspA family leucine-rich repeat surface protein [Proteobacteria bacterium]|nr:BspA family leucine-rich repeat surface protein [Pseudomonadota bacterium]
MKIILGLLAIFIYSGAIFAQDPAAYFRIIVDTRLPGFSDSNQFIIPTRTGRIYNYSVDCDSNGSFEATGQTGGYTCTYDAGGLYQVSIVGDDDNNTRGFPQIYFNNSGDRLKARDLRQWGQSVWSSMNSAFYGAANMIVQASDQPNLSEVTDVSSLFRQALLANPDTSLWDTSNVTDMVSMFAGASIANPDTSMWDTSKVTRMTSMFTGADNANPDTSGWDTSKVTSMGLMFGNTSIANPDTSGWNTSNVTGMSFMFMRASTANPNTSMWDTSNVTNMNSMFFFASNANPDTSGWDTSNVRNMSSMFSDASIANPDTSLWDTSQVTNMSSMFSGASIAIPDTSSWDTSQVTNMSSMFSGASIAIPDTSSWDTSKVESMDYMFRNAIFANPDVKNWDIRSVRSIVISGTQRHGFTGMFQGVTLPTLNYDFMLEHFGSQDVVSDLEFDAGNSLHCSGNQGRSILANTKNWAITDAGAVNCGNDADLQDFLIVVKTDNQGSTSDTQFRIPVEITFGGIPHNYNVSCQDNGGFDAVGVISGYTCNYSTPGVYQIRIVDVSGNGSGFSDIYFNNSGDRLKILDIKQWGSGKWQTMRSAFWGTANMIVTAKDQPDLSQVTSLENMFRGAQRANPDMKNWDFSNVTTMKRMFPNNFVVNPDASLWDTSQVTDMSFMFWQAYSANPDMSNWNISNVTTMQQMFNDVTLPISTYDAALINFDSQTHNNNVNFNAGNSQYCDGLDARANLIADSWNIADGGQECTPDRPLSAVQFSPHSDNTPLLRMVCDEPGNVIKIYLTNGIYNFTQVASHTCTTPSANFFEISTTIEDGSFFMQATESKNGDESLPSTITLGPGLLIDTTPPNIPTINPVSDIQTSITGTAEAASTINLSGATCTNSPVMTNAGGNWSCSLSDSLTAGIQITATAADAAGNISDVSLPITISGIDTTPPSAPIINPVSDIQTIITGTAEASSSITITGATCTNSRIMTDRRGNWSCNLPDSLIAGTVVTATATDLANNTSIFAGTVTVSAASEVIFANDFETN